MNGIQPIIQSVAPIFASALNGPFRDVAIKFVVDRLDKDKIAEGLAQEELLSILLKDSGNLQKLKQLEPEFQQEMKKLGVDVFALEQEIKDKQSKKLAATKPNLRPQIFLSALFLTAYFVLLIIIFVIEASDTINMEKGANSLMGQLHILFGVLTAGVGQILSFWFGGAFEKKPPAQAKTS